MSAPKRRRGTRMAELCIQVLVECLIMYTFYVTVVEIGWKWLIAFHNEKILGGLYLVTVLPLVSLLGCDYTSLIIGRASHNVPRYLVPDKNELTEPYECDNKDGDLTICAKCSGAWKPPRTHHCSTCGVCRMEFDHHCPWVGNCVTSDRMREFLALLFLVLFTYGIGFLPIYSTFAGHMARALAVSRNDAWASRVWWSWWGSWVFFGGPFGRWIFGMALGFRLLEAKRQPDLPMIEQPSLRLFALVAVGLLFSLFSLTLALWTIKDRLRGLTTLDAMQARGSKQASRFVCFPSSTLGGENASHRTMPVLPGEHLYDLGWRFNLQSLLRKPSRSVPFRWPTLNPNVINRMQKQMTISTESNSKADR